MLRSLRGGQSWRRYQRKRQAKHGDAWSVPNPPTPGSPLAKLLQRIGKSSLNRLEVFQRPAWQHVERLRIGMAGGEAQRAGKGNHRAVVGTIL